MLTGARRPGRLTTTPSRPITTGPSSSTRSTAKWASTRPSRPASLIPTRQFPTRRRWRAPWNSCGDKGCTRRRFRWASSTPGRQKAASCAIPATLSRASSMPRAMPRPVVFSRSPRARTLRCGRTPAPAGSSRTRRAHASRRSKSIDRAPSFGSRRRWSLFPAAR